MVAFPEACRFSAFADAALLKRCQAHSPLLPSLMADPWEDARCCWFLESAEGPSITDKKLVISYSAPMRFKLKDALPHESAPVLPGC